MDVAHSLADPQRHYPAIDRQVELSGGSKPVGAARFWREQNEKIDAFRALHAEACFTLRYEELTDRPDEALQPLFRFLGEPWEPDVLNYDRYPHHAGIEDPEVRRKRAIEPNTRASASWPEDVRAAVRATGLRQQGSLDRDAALQKIRGRHISTFDLIGEAEYRAGLERAERELPDGVEYALDWVVVVARS